MRYIRFMETQGKMNENWWIDYSDISYVELITVYCDLLLYLYHVWIIPIK